jgi:DNA-directed RNA polymerase specialized sigma24 family protein
MAEPQHRGPGHRVVERVLTEPDLKFRPTVDDYARRYLVDPDDLYQSASERLLRQGGVLPQHQGLRGWLVRCVNYAALDLVKDRARQPVAMAELPERPVAPPEPNDADQWLAQRLHRRVSSDQLRAILALARDPDLNLRDLARLIGKSYAGARQLKCRALARLSRLIGLTAAESVAYRGWHKGEGEAEVARRLGVDQSQVDRLRRAAAVKVRCFLLAEPGSSGFRRRGRG